MQKLSCAMAKGTGHTPNGNWLLHTLMLRRYPDGLQRANFMYSSECVYIRVTTAASTSMGSLLLSLDFAMANTVTSLLRGGIDLLDQ